MEKSIWKLGVVGAVIVGFATCNQAQAVFTLWTNAGTGDWYNAANWDTGVPTATLDHWVRNDGTANIAAAGAVTRQLNLGYDANGGATINVSGAGTLDIGSFTYVGRAGDAADVGTLNITGGGDVTSNNGVFMSYLSAATSVVNVDGAGSTWAITAGAFDFGRHGSSSINVSNGGAVTSDTTRVNMGFFDVGETSDLSITSGGTWTHGTTGDFKLGVGGTSTVTVDGAGSSLVNNDELFVGVNTAGILNITNGGTVDVTGAASDRVRVGFNNGATGAVTISGSGSTLSGKLVEVGWSAGSTGTVEISDGGLLVADDLFLSSDATTGIVKVGLDGMLAMLGDGSASITAFLDLMPDLSGVVVNSENIDYWNGLAFDDLTNATPGVDVDLTFHTSGDLSGYTVMTVIQIPEPATFALLALGSVAALLRRHR